LEWNFPPCSCVHTEEKDRMGNIFEQDFKETWNGEKYVTERKELFGQSNNLETICYTCTKKVIQEENLILTNNFVIG
jgi:hypothetical protein